MNKNNTIAIVGTGAAGISLANQIVRSLPLGLNMSGLTILMFDKPEQIGGGNAYAIDSHTNLMNTKCGAIDHGFGAGFGILQWAKDNVAKWKPYMLGRHIDEDTYAPRPVVGLYLQDLLQHAIDKAKGKGVDIRIVKESVVDIVQENHGYSIYTESANYHSRYTYLAIGHVQPKKKYSYQCNERYYHTPYPMQQLMNEIPKNATVGIIGSRLSAVDVAVGLSSAGHTGKMISISRQGRLPAVRAEYGKYQFKDIKREQLTDLLSADNYELRLHDIISMLRKEISHAEGRELMLSDVMRKDLGPVEYYENEIALSKGNERPWQAAIYATNSNIDLLWHYLNKADKKELLSVWSNDWLTYRASIPRQNAEKVLGLMKKGQLEVLAGATGFDFNDDSNKFEMLRSNAESTIEVDYLISATGSTGNILEADNTLLENLVAKGMIRPHEHGGIDCCFASGRIFPEGDASNESSRFFAVGPLTSGVYFFTTALEVIERQSKERAAELAFMLTEDAFNLTVARPVEAAFSENALHYLDQRNTDTVHMTA
ncbi:MAG: hypothetical protein CMH98_10985 [Oceanospirillaceae bacterium]|nr:hypothetical protein [Oceanospirillaceae bacterium]